MRDIKFRKIIFHFYHKLKIFLLFKLKKNEFGQIELDPEFQRILNEHNLKGKRKRTRW